jgi:hypothetical protein
VTLLIQYSLLSCGLVVACLSGCGTAADSEAPDRGRFIGIDLRKEHCQRIVERLSQRELPGA